MDKNRVWGLKSLELAGEEARSLPRLRTVDRCQMVLRPTNVEQLIEADHPARAIWEIVGQQNLDGFYGAIEAVEGVGALGVGPAPSDQPVDLCVYASRQLGPGDFPFVPIPSGLSVVDGVAGD